MTQPNLPGLQVPASYWNKETEAFDAERKKYRSIPVPAHLNNNQKHIDDATRLELLVEHLATKNDFGDFDMRELQGKTPEDIMDQINIWGQQVQAASPEKKEDAQRSFGGHLEDFGAAIGRGILTGVGKVAGAPGISHTLSAISMPGEEITAQILYNFAKFIPGEQDIERGVRQWKEDNPDAPWWKQGFLTPAVREHGFGVPMGVHLPMEIIFDPLNLIPIGAAFKLAKPTMTMYKLMGKGKTAPEAFRLTRRLQRAQRYANDQAQIMLDEIAKAEEAFKKVDLDVVGVDPATGQSQYNRVYWSFSEGGGGPAFPEGRKLSDAEQGKFQTTEEAYQTHVEETPINDQLIRANSVHVQSNRRLTKQQFDENMNELFEIGEVQQWDEANFPGVRGTPFHGSSQTNDGLYAIAHDEEFFAGAVKSGFVSLEDSRRAKWALQLMWHTGIRPHEIKYIEWNDIINMLQRSSPGQERYLRLTQKQAGDATGKESVRLLDDEAVDFFKRYRDAVDGRRKQTDRFSQAFQLPSMRKARTDDAGKKIAGDDTEIAHLQDIFRGAAIAKGEEGQKLLEFYKDNGNFSYVFRLSKAGQVFENTKGEKGLTDLMKMMGHTSTAHTARYVSFFQHRFNTKMAHLLENLAGKTESIEDAVNAVNRELATGTWRDDLDPKDLAKLETRNNAHEPVKAFSSISVGAADRKGFKPATRLAASEKLKELRQGIIRSSLSKEVDGEVIFPVSLRESTAGGLRPGQVSESLAAVQQLQTLALNIQETIIQKRFISNIRELKGKNIKVTPEVKASLNAIRAEARSDMAQMQEWIEPLLKVADEHLMVLDRATGHGAALSGSVTSYTLVADAFATVFRYIDHMELQRIDYQAKEGSGFAGKTLGKVSDRFELLFNMKGVTTTTRQSTKTAKDQQTRYDQAMVEKGDLTEDEIAGMNRFRETSNVGWIIRPTKEGQNIKNTTSLKDRQIMERSRTPENPDGAIGNPKYNPFSSKQRTWMITGWLTEGGEIFDNTKHTMQEVGAALVTKLGANYTRAGKINLAQKPETFTIPVFDLDAWVLARSEPVPPSLVRLASHGGHAKLHVDDVVEHLFKMGITPGGYHSMRTLQKEMGKELRGDRLKYNKHLIATEESGSLKTALYGWSEEVTDAFKARMERAEGDFGYGVFGEPPKQPPAPPGVPTSGGDFPGWGDWDLYDEAGNPVTLGDVIRIPRNMQQVMQWGSLEWTKIFNKLPPVLHKPMSKAGRALIGQTAGATEAAKLRWMFYMSKMEGQETASNIGHMLEQMHKDMGSNRRTGRGTTIEVSQSGIAGKDLSINPDTGEFVDEMLIARDYYRREGNQVAPDSEWFNPEMATKMGKPLTESQFLGPVAMMEVKFKRFSDEAPDIWTPGHIKSERRKFNHLQVMQDMTTYLNTNRDDLLDFYNITSEAGVKQLAWWDKYHRIMPHLYDLMRKSGFDIDNDVSILGKPVKEFRDSFVPSTIVNTGDEIMLKGVSSLGSIPSQMLKRQHHWQIENMLDQGADKGLIKYGLYNTDPVISIQRTIEAYYDWIARQKFMDEYQRLGYLKAEMIGHIPMKAKIKTFINAKGAAKIESKLTPAEERVAEKFFGPNWDTMTDEALDARSIKLQEMSLSWRDQAFKDVRELAPEDHKLHQTVLPEDANNELKALVRDIYEPQSKFITWPSMISNTMRLMATGADLGVMLLHGIGGIGVMASPSPWIGRKQRMAWAKGVARMGKSLLEPEVRAQWYQSTIPVRQDMQKYNVGFFRSTHIEDLPLPGVFTKGRYWPELQEGAAGKVRGTAERAYVPMERMMQGFGFFLDVSKTEMWKVQALAIRRNAGAIDELDPNNPQIVDPTTLDTATRETMELELNDLAASLNAMHGTLQPAVVGLPQKQRVFESAFLLYAALYRRSAAALIANMMSGVPQATYDLIAKGDVVAAKAAIKKRKWRSGQALSSISGMLIAGAAIGFAIKESGLNDDVFSMGSADFMSVKVGNMRLGIGTPFYSFLRMGKDVVDQMAEDPTGAAEVNFSDNALLKWFRSGASPVTSIGIDVFSGADFIGDPLRDTTGGWEVTKIGDRITRNLVPFWLDSLGESVIGSKELPPSASLAEFFGLRVSPQSPYGRMKAAKNVAILLSGDPEVVAWRESQIAQGLPVDDQTIPKLFLQKLVEESPEMQQLELEISADVQHRGSYDRKRQDTYITEIRLNREGDGSEEDLGIIGLTKKLEGVADKYERGLFNGREMRQQVELLEAENRGRNQQSAFTHRDVVLNFNTLRQERMDDPAAYHILDHWYDRYRTEVTSAINMHDEYGNFNIAEFKKRNDAFRKEIDAKFPGVGWKYIEGRRNKGDLLPPLMQELEKARNEELLPFWNLADKLGAKNADHIHNWRSQTTKEGKAYYQLKHPQVMPLLKILGRIQDNYRRHNPRVDYLLVKFYDYTALTAQGKRYENERRRKVIINANQPEPVPV